ncbi:uncharacterized protein ACRADG_005296 [Cochliomyia hominivorax]
MKFTWLFLITFLMALKYRTINGAPLTQWFKTDDNIYYIESRNLLTWQQSFQECQKKNMSLITLMDSRKDKLLLEYLRQNYDKKSYGIAFWLRIHESITLKDIKNILSVAMASDLLNTKDCDNSVNHQADNRDLENYALSVNGIVKASKSLNGFICHEKALNDRLRQQIQNYDLEFN